MRILLLGATGLVGGEVLQQALDHEKVTQVIAPVRRQLPVAHEKLLVPIINFDDFSADAKSWQFDAVICALGTTMKKAKSRDMFRKIDYDYPVAFALLAKQKKAEIFALNSAMGVNSRSAFFYSKVKGELEEQLQLLDFDSLILVRPGLIEGERDEFRLGEGVAIKVSKWLNPVLPQAFRPNQAKDIAKALLENTLNAKRGTKIISSAELI